MVTEQRRLSIKLLVLSLLPNNRGTSKSNMHWVTVPQDFHVFRYPGYQRRVARVRGMGDNSLVYCGLKAH